jgi:putative ABC transport system substrate-binding protein
MAYGPNFTDLYRRRDLCGQDPERRQACDLPVEQPTKFELVINLKTAKALGLTIPSIALGASGRDYPVMDPCGQILDARHSLS